MDGLLRYVDPVHGPILGVDSSPQPGILRPAYWFSRAKLAVLERFSERLARPLAGAGWSPDKETSQRKAVTEGIERWAHATTRPRAAGLDRDPTTNGFAALPLAFPNADAHARRLALDEAVERWAMTRLSGTSPLPLQRFPPGKAVLALWRSPRNLELFGASIASETDGVTQLRIAIGRFASGGIVLGAACACDPAAAEEKAWIEAFNGRRKFLRVIDGNEQLLPRISLQRLWHYATDPRAAGRLRARLAERTQAGAATAVAPSVILSARIAGPWESDFVVWRCLVDDAPPPTEGGLDRWIF